ncbi:MAG TPA: hypothetical protein VE467_08105 [Chryseolinea sp.]|nr:hypothetical protein [Chryseolinea sp.]
MELWIAILAGLVGTLVMTCFSQITAYFLKKPFYVVTILAMMLPFKKNVSAPNVYVYTAATVLHYFIGFVFAYIYFWQLEWLISNDIVSALLYGAIIGSIAIIGWKVFFSIHPNPPPIELTLYLIMIWFGHIALSVTASAIFGFFWSSEIPICGYSMRFFF